MKRLNTDRTIAPLVAQFVPVKIDVASDDYGLWRREHKVEGNAIPQLFIVRADGKTLYGKSGAPSGADLPRLLVQALRSSGKIISARDALSLSKAADDFERLMDEKQPNQAIKSLAKIRRIGEPGTIQSFAAPATRINELVNSSITQVNEQIESLAEGTTGTAKQQLDSLLTYLRLKREYSGMKVLKSSFAKSQVMKFAIKNPQLAKEAKLLDSAKIADSKTTRARAREQLTLLILESDSAVVRQAADAALAELKKQSE